MAKNNLQPKEQGGGVTAEAPMENFYSPRVDIVETDEGLVLYADVPGVAADGAEVRYDNGELTLHCRCASREPGRSLYAEYGVGDFYRTFTLQDIDAEKISAELKNGVLKVNLPKVEALKPRRIVVKST